MADIATIAEAVTAGDLGALSDLNGIDDYEALMTALEGNDKLRTIIATDVPDLQFAYNVRMGDACFPLDEDEVADIIEADAEDLTADLAVLVAAKVYEDESGEQVESQRTGTESEDEWTGWVEQFSFTLTRDDDEYELTFEEVE